MSRSRTLWLSVAVMVAGTAVLWADGLRNPPEGGAALGRAGVRLTQGDDASAVTHNPANLMDLKEAEAMVTATFGFSTKTYTTPTGIEQDSDEPTVVLPAVYAAVPLDGGNYVAGIGVNVPYGQSSIWEKNGPLSYGLADYARMRSINVNPTLATKFGDAVRVGAGVDILWSDLLLKGIGSTSEGDGWGYGANAGVTWLVTANQRLALTYRSSISVDYEGDFAAKPEGIMPTSTFKMDGLEFPAVAGIGYGIQMTPSVRVEANVEWVQHSVNETWTTTAMGTTVAMPQNWEDTWTYGVGADWQVCKNWTLRGGWMYLPSPIPDSTMSPLLTEGDKQVLALGLGFKSGKHAVDVAYAYNVCEDRNVSDVRNPVNGAYEYQAQLCSASYRFAF